MLYWHTATSLLLFLGGSGLRGALVSKDNDLHHEDAVEYSADDESYEHNAVIHLANCGEDARHAAHKVEKERHEAQLATRPRLQNNISTMNGYYKHMGATMNVWMIWGSLLAAKMGMVKPCSTTS